MARNIGLGNGSGTGNKTAHIPYPDHPGAKPRRGASPFDVNLGMSTAMQVAHSQFIAAASKPRKKK